MGFSASSCRDPQRDRALGGKRPDAVTSLARRGRASSTRRGACGWRATAGRSVRRSSADYRGDEPRRSTGSPRMRPSLEDLKSLAGRLALDARHSRTRVAPILRQSGTVRSARRASERARAAGQRGAAGRERRGHPARSRASPASIARAWDASSAAAGALMLGARARRRHRGACSACPSSGDHAPSDATRSRVRSARLSSRHRRTVAARACATAARRAPCDRADGRCGASACRPAHLSRTRSAEHRHARRLVRRSARAPRSAAAAADGLSSATSWCRPRSAASRSDSLRGRARRGGPPLLRSAAAAVRSGRAIRGAHRGAAGARRRDRSRCRAPARARRGLLAAAVRASTNARLRTCGRVRRAPLRARLLAAAGGEPVRSSCRDGRRLDCGSGRACSSPISICCRACRDLKRSISSPPTRCSARDFTSGMHEWLPGLEEVEASALCLAAAPSRAAASWRCRTSVRRRRSWFVRSRSRGRADRDGTSDSRHRRSTTTVSPSSSSGRCRICISRPRSFGAARIPYRSPDALPLAAESMAARSISCSISSRPTSPGRRWSRCSGHRTLCLRRDARSDTGSGQRARPRVEPGAIPRRSGAPGWRSKRVPMERRSPVARRDDRGVRALATASRRCLTAAPVSRQLSAVSISRRARGPVRPRRIRSGARLDRGRAPPFATLLTALAAAHEAHDDRPMDDRRSGGAVRRWIGEQTFPAMIRPATACTSRRSGRALRRFRSHCDRRPGRRRMAGARRSGTSSTRRAPRVARMAVGTGPAWQRPRRAFSTSWRRHRERVIGLDGHARRRGAGRSAPTHRRDIARARLTDRAPAPLRRTARVPGRRGS